MHELTGALKMMLREMDPPLLTYELYPACVEIGSTMSVRNSLGNVGIV